MQMITRNLNGSEFLTSAPFNHIVIDDFFPDDVANRLADEFPDYTSEVWHVYDNAIENKKTSNSWNSFGPLTYNVVRYLNSSEFVGKLDILLGESLYSDPGLHGGGWHIHARGGKLNIHLDYDIHPKMRLQRKLNLIIYLTRGWDPKWGGGLELWNHDESTNSPGSCVVKVENRFNRAILFDTTQNSWHGLPEALNCPHDVYRKSLATYYLQTPKNASDRERALFAPYKEQKSDPGVLKLIEDRSDKTKFNTAYVKK